jgi:hypothetical protein
MHPTRLKSRFLLIAAGLITLTFVVRGGTPTALPAEHFLDHFNDAVQKRFHDVIGFGMARVATERWFMPETPEEKKALRDLKKGGYQVGLFLAGRNMLQDVPLPYRVSYAKTGSGGQHIMSGPVIVANKRLTGLPDAPAMWEPTREALRQFSRGAERWAFEAGGWSVEARPVRASDEKCLRCHAYRKLIFQQQNGAVSMRYGEPSYDLQIGDPIGAVLYVYRRKD